MLTVSNIAVRMIYVGSGKDASRQWYDNCKQLDRLIQMVTKM